MLEIKLINKPKNWEQFLLRSSQANFLQSFAWGEFHQSLNHLVFRFGVYHQEKLIGLFLLIKVKAKRGTYFECPGGPVIDWNKEDQVKEVIDFMAQFCREQKADFIRIRPNVAVNENRLELLKKNGFLKAPMHLHAENTWIINLHQDLDKLLSQMRKNTRYSIRKAEKMGVNVEVSQEIQDVDLLYKLQMETAKRHKFVPFSINYLKSQFKSFSKNNQIQLFKARYKGKVIAAAFIIFYGKEAIYHYSGSTLESRKIPASYLLQWEVIKAAKKMGLNRYNLWGVNKDQSRKHRFAGVTLFKTGFGGEPLDYVPAHDLPLSVSYWPIFLFETLRRKLRRL